MLITDISVLYSKNEETSENAIYQKINDLIKLTQDKILVEQGIMNVDDL